MKISCLPWGVLAHRGHDLGTYREWFEFAAHDPNLEAVDLIDGAGSLYGTPARKEESRSLKPMLDDLGLPVMMFVSHGKFAVDPIPPDEQDRFKYLVEQAVFFGAEVFRTTTGLAEPGELFRKGVMENVVSGLRWLAGLVREAGLPLIVENHHETSDEMLVICQRLADLGVRLNGEIKPAVRYHMDPYAYVQRLVPYATCYHIDNFRYDPDAKHDQDRAGRKLERAVPLDQGEIDIRRILTIIKTSGFDGWLSIEYGGFVDGFSDLGRSARFLKTTWDSM